MPQSDGTLSYWYIARLHNTGGGQTRVHQYAYLSYAGGSNYYIMDVMEDTNYNWRERTFDMAPFAGQAVTLTLGVNISIGDDGAGASLNLDDVTIHWQQPDFADVSPDNTFYPYVMCLACRWVDTGYACGGEGEPCVPNNAPYFRPNSLIMRDDLSHMVASAAGFNEPPGGAALRGRALIPFLFRLD